MPVMLSTFRQNAILAELSESDLSLIAPHLSIVPLTQGEVLQDQEARVERVYFPLSGLVSLIAMMRNGTGVEAAVIGREGIVNVCANTEPQFAISRAVVQVPGTAVVTAAGVLGKACRESRSLQDVILRYRDLLFAQVQQTGACNALHTLDARLARWLLQGSDRTGTTMLPVTQEFLAQVLGVTRTSVTVAVASLQALNLIKQRRGSVSIVDRAGLEANACECYGAHRRRERQFAKNKLDQQGIANVKASS
jgi:CRP-like cAMP-binding protein